MTVYPSLGHSKLIFFFLLAKGFLVKKILTILKASMVTVISKGDSDIKTFLLIALCV